LKDLHVLPITRALIADLLPENLAIENQAIENLAIGNQVTAEVQIEAVQDLQEVE
jgi:hypothetical protein